MSLHIIVRSVPVRWTNAYFSFSKHRRSKDGNHSFIPNSKVEARSIFDRHISLELAVDRSIGQTCNSPSLLQ